MKIIHLSFSLFFFYLALSPVFSQEIIWENIEETDHVNDSYISVDQYNNTYLCFSGLSDYYLGKYDQDGILEWGVSDTNMSHYGSCKINESGKIYITGALETSPLKYECVVNVYTPQGMLQSQFFYSSSAFKNDTGFKIDVDDDGNIIVFGMTFTTTDFETFILKMNSSGMILWVQSISYNSYTLPLRIKLDEQGNIYTTAFRALGSDTIRTYIAKFDKDGQQLFHKHFELDGFTAISIPIIEFDMDGNFLLVGVAQNSYTVDGCCIKSNPDGEMIWYHTFRANANELGIYDVNVDLNNNIYLAGNILIADYDAYYAKLSPDGDMIWEKTSAGPGAASDQFHSIQLSGNYCYFAGNQYGISSGQNFFVRKTDLDGNTIWDLIWDGDSHLMDGLDVFCFDNDNNIILSGFTESQFLDHDGVTVKYTNPLDVDELIINKSSLKIFPNPAGASIHIKLPESHKQYNFIIFNSPGEIALSGSITSSENTIETYDLKNGLYFMLLDDGHKQYNAKFVKH